MQDFVRWKRVTLFFHVSNAYFFCAIFFTLFVLSAIANFNKFWGKTNKDSNNIKFVRPSGIIERREEIWISSEASKQSESPILQYSKPGYARLSGQWSAVNIGLIYIQWQGQIGGKYLPFVEHWNQFSRSKYFGKEKSGSAFSGSVFFPLLELLITVVTFITLITGKGAVFTPMFYSTSTASNFVLSPTCEWYTFGYCTTFSHLFYNRLHFIYLQTNMWQSVFMFSFIRLF